MKKELWAKMQEKLNNFIQSDGIIVNNFSRSLSLVNNKIQDISLAKKLRVWRHIGARNFYLSVLLLTINISQSQSEKLICYCTKLVGKMNARRKKHFTCAYKTLKLIQKTYRYTHVSQYYVRHWYESETHWYNWYLFLTSEMPYLGFAKFVLAKCPQSILHGLFGELFDVPRCKTLC